MAKWGTFKWGTEKWGARSNVIGWAFEVDWNGDGIFSGSNEANHMIGLTIDRGRDFYINSESDGFEPVTSGRAVITLDNSSKRYDPYNVTSDLYPNVTPGKLCRISVKPVGMAKIIRFTGYIDDIRPISGTNNVSIVAVDKLSLFKNTTITLSMQSGKRVSELITAILVGIGETDYDIDSLLDIVPYYWANSKGVNEAITELVDASIGSFFISASGTIKYYQRIGTVSAVGTIAQDKILREIETPQPWDTIRNNIEIIVNPRELIATGTIWELGDTPAIPNGSSITIWADYSYNNTACPATNVITPVASTDYAMNTQEDGLGADLTAGFAIVFSAFGQSAKIVITNNSGSSGYVTMFKIRGDAVFALDTGRINIQDTASQALYQTRSFILNSEWIQNVNTATEIANILNSFMPLPRKFPTVQFENQFSEQFNYDLFDRVNCEIAELGINDSFRIGQIHDEWLSENGQKILTTYKLEPVIGIITSDTWIFPTSIGVTSNFA
jgi:hypothetical protein